MDVLIGHTGFVGSTLARQRRFDLCVNRSNLAELGGLKARRLFLSALPAEKWRINADPAADLANIALLQRALLGVQAESVVLVSTVDVYADPVDVDEGSDVGAASPYGAHRHAFETWVRDRFAKVLVLRLPGLFGAGLKKNALYDLANDNQVDRLHPQAQLQWYPLRRLSNDIDLALASGLPLVNATVEPVSTGAIATRLFGRTLAPPPGAAAPALYRVRSRHAAHFGGHAGYWLDAAALWRELQTWHSEATR